MNKVWWGGFIPLVFVAVAGAYLPFDYQSLEMSAEEAQIMGRQIWQNECAGKRTGLTCWNEGEEFASLGIGHFIWYPEDQQGVFKETFPSLIIFLAQQGVDIPEWLRYAQGCPWKTKEEFQIAQEDLMMEQLRQFLIDHIDLQVQFMVERLQRALPALLKNLSSDQKKHIHFQFYRLAHTSCGIYVLLDYLNFKGEGLASHEHYKGQGWGLLQVLEQMNGTAPGRLAIEEFIQGAQTVLAKRVQNAPPERREQRWLKGWYNRLDSYLHFSFIDSLAESN
jgi:hypothetical protein